jgi:rRNA pseudouridine-1189 N-methylase Emg1 (Nep1/Mra1 family)
MEVDYIHETLCVSKYPLSAAYATSKILYSFEKKWNLI